MSSREVILRRIRDALGPDPHIPAISRDYHHTSDLDHAAAVDRFADMVDDYRATVHRCEASSLPALLASIATAASAHRVAVPDGLNQAWLADLDDIQDVEVTRDSGVPAQQLDTIDLVITGSAVAIADTGTIVLDASPDQGTRALTLVPDHHICLVPTDRIVTTVPEALRHIEPTRPITLISGPSATSDIELDRVEGVHGPRTLDVIIIHVD